MKRNSGIFEGIVAWENLLLAEKRARKGKRHRIDVAQFHWNLEEELVSIQRDLQEERYRPGPYRSFEISDPKRRMISAAPYRDRVVHHAICNQIEPLLDRSFVFDSYACRKGKGQVAALGRAQRWMRRYRFVARTDIRKYFASIDHDLLLDQLQRRFKDTAFHRLVDLIVRTPFPRQERPAFFPGDDLLTHAGRSCGLPLGNQTSQLFGNLYLDRIDHQLKECIRIPALIRYMDDVVLFSNSKFELWQAIDWLRQAMAGLRLRLHDRKTTVTTTRDGIRFLGHHVNVAGCRMHPEALVRLRRRLKILQRKYEGKESDLAQIQQVVASYWGIFHRGGYRKTFRQVVTDYPFWTDLLAARKSSRSTSQSHQ
jgi:retron-type reverse transcriptase